jgi:CRP/FNR family cyclic AMP-dependent transcriptional regulator
MATGFRDTSLIQRLLPGVPPAAAELVAATSTVATFRVGETIMGAGRSWWPAVVAEGNLELTILSPDGREATLRFIGPGVIFGLVALFEPDYSDPTPERRMVAVERSTLIFLQPSILRRLIHDHSEFSLHVIRGLVSWGGALSDAAGRYAFMTVRQRVAAHLLGVARLEPGAGDGGAVNITQQELADAVGSVREVVARILHDLRVAGAISVSRSTVTILDRQRLSQLAQLVAPNP